MCDDATNLIDLNNDVDTQIKSEQETRIPSPMTCLIMPPLESRDSLDNKNNPFDSLQRLASRPDDPFDIAEKEASAQARNSIQPVVEVKMANLLSLSDDNSLECKSAPTETSACSTIYHTATTIDLDSESPPLTMSSKWTPDSCNSVSEGVGESASSTDSGGSTSTKTKKALDYRKRLLKLSISNSTFHTPLTCRVSTQHESGFSQNENLYSPVSAVFSEASECNENMLSAESPLKFVDDDLMAEEPPNFGYLEKDFDADLEMLKIPMLKQLPSPVIEDCLELETASPNSIQYNNNSTVGDLPDLATIRAKLRAKRESPKNSEDINQMIQKLKTLISDIDGDTTKKQRASSLLETLSTALTSSPKRESEVGGQGETSSTLEMPPPIVRQGTFDIELQEKEDTDNKELPSSSSTVAAEMSHLTQSTHATLFTHEFPDDMVKSSATYDAETAEDKEELKLPEVEPLSPSAPLSPAQLEINDIVGQLSKLLEHHNLNRQSQSDSADGTGNGPSINPTFIVVMNNSQLATATATQMANDINDSCNKESPDFEQASTILRRRSQSLSSHDKIKIVHLPFQRPPPIQMQQDIVETPTSRPVDTEVKTPTRSMMRRNSFSSGIMHTPLSSNYGRRRNGYVEAIAKPSTQLRRSVASDQQQERAQHSLSIRSMPMPHGSLNVKNKVKSNSVTNSIMKSTGPLKATIPFKKVMPAINISPPSPTAKKNMVGSSLNKSSLNNSMHFLTKTANISHISTPMPASRRVSTVGLASAGYPNACSTPAVHTSPLRRLGTGTNKSRYSFAAATPSTRTVSLTATATALKRRTLTEFRAKSPIKPRASNIGTTSLGKSTTRASMKSAASASTAPQSRMTATTATTERTTLRLSMRGSNIATAGTTYKNKENKYP